MIPKGPTSPHVPIPAPIGTFSNWNTHVAIGPVMAAANVGGIHVKGFFMMLGICNIDVPMPCETSPPQRFSLNDITANPTIWAQHPAVAAPAAIPDRPMAIHKAALLIGNVNAIPTETDTMTPIMKGRNSVAFSINLPKASMKALMPGPTNIARSTPLIITTDGVTRMSTLVSLETSFPSSVLMTVATYAPTGPPNALPAIPQTVAENKTREGACSEYAIATPIAAPVACLAYFAISSRNGMFNLSPNVVNIVPINNEANKPNAIAPRASRKYALAQTLTDFLSRKDLKFMIYFIMP